LKFGIERDGNITEKVLIPEPMDRINTGTSVGAEASSVTLTTVEPGMPAAQAGIKVGDSILTPTGRTFHTWRRSSNCSLAPRISLCNLASSATARN